MDFSTQKRISRDRFSEVLLNLRFIASSEPRSLTEESSQEVRIQRGLYYVHLYSALEKTVNEVVEQALLIVQTLEIPNDHLQFNFNVISLDPKMQAFKQSSYKNYFQRSSIVFKSIESRESFNINNTVFSKSLQNIWFATIQETLECFGLETLAIEPRVRTTVDEVVDKRNAVAHGRESASVVGQRFRSPALRNKTNDIQLVANMFLDRFETFIADRMFIREGLRSNYL